MTPQERDEKIVSILTKICINVLVKNLFDKMEYEFTKKFYMNLINYR
jgi:hypothetical protein